MLIHYTLLAINEGLITETKSTGQGFLILPIEAYTFLKIPVHIFFFSVLSSKESNPGTSFRASLCIKFVLQIFPARISQLLYLTFACRFHCPHVFSLAFKKDSKTLKLTKNRKNHSIAAVES